MVSQPSLPGSGAPEAARGIEIAAALPADGTGVRQEAAMLKRRALRATAIVFVALSVGQIMQSYRPGEPAVAMAMTPQQAMLANTERLETEAVLTPVAPGLLVKASLTSTDGGAGPAGGRFAAPSHLAATGGQPDTPLAAAPGCPTSLRVSDQPGAMLGLSLVSPCRAGERVVLRHAGLAVTGRLDADGHLSMALPALDSGGAVSAVFADGARVNGAAAVPELAGMRRLALEWRPGGDFALHVLENGAGIGQAGDVSAAHPGRPAGGGGWLVRLGAADVAAPLMADVYTYPRDYSVAAKVAIVAHVTRRTCGHRMLAETITSRDGRAEANDLTLAAPGCGGTPGALVLNGLFPDMRIASGQ